MIVTVKYMFGALQTVNLPDDAGTSRSTFDEETGRSVEASSLDTDAPSFRSCWMGPDGSILVARCKMCERNDFMGEARMRVGDPAGVHVHGPSEPYSVVPASMMDEVEFVEVDGVRIFEAQGAATAQAGGKQAVEQFRRHALDAQARQRDARSPQIR